MVRLFVLDGCLLDLCELVGEIEEGIYPAGGYCKLPRYLKWTGGLEFLGARRRRPIVNMSSILLLREFA